MLQNLLLNKIWPFVQNILNNKLTPLLASISALFLPIYPIMIVITLLLIFDFITGIWAAKKLKVEITSRKMSDTVAKIVLYNMALIGAFSVDTWIINVYLLNITASFIALTEFKSLAENIGKITGLNIWLAVKQFFRRRKDDFSQVFNNLENNEEKKEEQ